MLFTAQGALLNLFNMVRRRTSEKKYYYYLDIEQAEWTQPNIIQKGLRKWETTSFYCI
jgi:hypothetical protein